MTWYYHDVRVGSADEAGMYASAIIEAGIMDLHIRYALEMDFKEYLDSHHTASNILDEMKFMGFDALADCIDALFIGYVACELDRCRKEGITEFGPFNWQDE